MASISITSCGGVFEYLDSAGIRLTNPCGQFGVCPVSVGTLKQQSKPVNLNKQFDLLTADRKCLEAPLLLAELDDVTGFAV